MADEPRPKRVWWRSIHARLLGVAAVLLIVPTLVGGFLVYGSARDALEPKIEALLERDAILAERGIQEVLIAHDRALSTWSRVQIMRALPIGDIDKTISEFLLNARRGSPDNLDLLAIDRSARCIASTAPEQIGRRISPDLVAAWTGAFDEGAVRFSTRHGKLYLALSAPILDPDQPHRVLGSLVAMLDLAALGAASRVPSHVRDVEIRLVDSYSRILMGPELTRDAQSLPLWPLDPAPAERETSSVYTAISRGGAPLIIGEAPLDLRLGDRTLHWRVLASLRQDDALAPVRTLRQQILGVGSLISVLGLALAWRLSLSLARPLAELTTITSRMTALGALEAIPESDSDNEIGDLARSFRQMVQKVAEAQRQLVQSEKLAFLGELAAGIAHELRTPLGIIKNSAQLIERRMDRTGNERDLEFARFIHEECDRLNRVISNLLSFARPTAHSFEPVDLAALAQQAVRYLQDSAHAKSLDLEISQESRSLVVECESGQIYQVCLNLIENAIHASPEGGPIRVATLRKGEWALLRVQDQGEGLSPEVEGQLFQPFVSKRAGGIGLGLAIVKRIVDAHGGTIEARNHRPGGAVFEVQLPIVHTAEAPADGEPAG